MSRLSHVLLVPFFLATAGMALAQQMPGPALTSFSFQDDVVQGGSCTAACNPYGGPCGDPCCAPCCGPSWTAEAGAVLLGREDDNNIPLMKDPNGGVCMSACDFDTDLEAGSLVRLVRHRPCGPDLEFRFFFIDHFSDEQIYAGFPDGTRFVVQQPNPFYFRGNTGPNPIAFRSELYSSELNTRWCVAPWLDVLAGFRWVEMHEQIDMSLRFAGLHDRNLINAGNHMYGFQLGADAVMLRCGRIRFDGLVKAGVYGNWASGVSSFQEPRGTTGWGTEDSEGVVSFLGEVNLTARYQLTCSVELAAGYQFLWMDGVALAGQQLPAMNVPFTGTGDGVGTSGTPLYHGALLSLSYTR